MTNEERAKLLCERLAMQMPLSQNVPMELMDWKLVMRALDEAEERGAEALRKQALFVLGMARQNESGEGRLDGLRHAHQLVQNVPWKP